MTYDRWDNKIYTKNDKKQNNLLKQIGNINGNLQKLWEQCR